MNWGGKCWATQKTTWALRGSARAAGLARGPNAESQFWKEETGNGLGWLPGGGGSRWGWPEHTTSDRRAPPPRSNTIPCIAPRCPGSLVCTSHGAQLADLRRHAFVTHCSEPSGNKPQPTPRVGWRAKCRCFGRKGDRAAGKGRIWNCLLELKQGEGAGSTHRARHRHEERCGKSAEHLATPPADGLANS